jgi:hypothetical protein
VKEEGNVGIDLQKAFCRAKVEHYEKENSPFFG